MPRSKTGTGIPLLITYKIMPLFLDLSLAECYQVEVWELPSSDSVRLRFVSLSRQKSFSRTASSPGLKCHEVFTPALLKDIHSEGSDQELVTVKSAFQTSP